MTRATSISSIVSVIVAALLLPLGADATIMAPEGTKFAYLTTGPGPTGAGSSGVDVSADGGAFGAGVDGDLMGFEADVATMSIAFTAPVAGSISFELDVLTAEISGAIPDPFAVLLDGTVVVSGAIGVANGLFPAVVGFDGTLIVGPDGSSFFDGRLGFSTVSVPAVTAGAHVLDFFVGDEFDFAVDTALLVDGILNTDGSLIAGFEADPLGSAPGAPVTSIVGNVTVQGGDGFTVIDVGEPSTLALLAFLFAGTSFARRRRYPA